MQKQVMFFFFLLFCSVVVYRHECNDVRRKSLYRKNTSFHYKLQCHHFIVIWQLQDRRCTNFVFSEQLSSVYGKIL